MESSPTNKIVFGARVLPGSTIEWGDQLVFRTRGSCGWSCPQAPGPRAGLLPADAQNARRPAVLEPHQSIGQQTALFTTPPLD